MVAAAAALMTDSLPPRSPASSGSSALPPTAPLRRRWLLNLGLLVLVAGLGLFAWYRAGVQPEQTKQPLTNLTADTVRFIEVERPQRLIVRLERVDGDWRLTAPIDARGDSFAIGSLLQLLQAPIEGSVASTGTALARFGLDPPQVTVRFDGAVIRFGEVHPLKNEHFVQHGTAVHLLPSRYYASAAAPHTNYIDSRLIEPGRRPIALKLADFALTLDDDGTWRREPTFTGLSSDRINAFVDEWRHARALQVQEYAGRKPQARVVLTLENPDGSRSELAIGVLAREPELILHRPDEDLQYHFPAGMDQRLLNLNEQ